MELIERPLLVPKVLDSNLTHLLPYPDSTRLPENEMLGAPLVWIYSRSEAGLKKSNTLYNYSVFRGRHKIEMPRKIRAPTNDV